MSHFVPELSHHPLTPTRPGPGYPQLGHTNLPTYVPAYLPSRGIYIYIYFTQVRGIYLYMYVLYYLPTYMAP